MPSVIQRFIDSKSAPFDADRFHDHYQSALRELIEGKLKGELAKTKRGKEKGGAQIIDLTEALKRSLGGKGQAAAKAGNKTRIGVTGHTDRAGSDAYNMALSLRRANAVKDQLVREGIPAAGITVVGRGESQPLVPTADGVREPQNRRVEIVLQ